MANPFVPRPRELVTAGVTTDILQELWSFYQFMLSNDEVAKQFDQWKTYDMLKKEHEL